MKIKTVSNYFEDWPDGVPGMQWVHPYKDCYQCNKPSEDGKMWGYILWLHNIILDKNKKPVYVGLSRPINIIWFDTKECRKEWHENRGDKAKSEVALKDDQA